MTRSSSLTAAALLAAVSACGGGRIHPATAPGVNVRAERELASDLGRVFDAPIMNQGLWGVEVKSLDTGRVLYTRNAHTLMMPASNMKILTLATAASALGWDYRFTTVLETAADVRDGVLAGDLIVRGSGDPTINTRDGRADALFDQWASALRAAGISRISGNIVGDDNAFDDEGLGQGWSWDYLQYGYAAPVGALEFDENIATLTVTPAPAVGQPAVVQLQPGAGLTVVNRAFTGDAGSALTIDYVRHLDRPVLDVTGSIAAGAPALARDVAVVNPTVFFAEGLKQALAARGIAVDGAAVDGDDVAAGLPAPESRRAIVSSQSPTLRDIATVMMKVSQNLYAETLLKACGAATAGLGTTEAGRLTTHALFASWGIPDTEFVQVDGSGLSRYDFVTPATLVAILEHLSRSPVDREPFLATLPIAGRDGTIKGRLKKTRAEGNALAKTGSIANVRSLSGYVKTRDGETLVFSIVANAFAIPATTVNWIADLAVETLANYTNAPGVQ